MKRDDQFEEALAEVRREYREMAIPGYLEERLLRASRELHSARKRSRAVALRWAWAAGGALAAMLLIGILVRETQKTAPRQMSAHTAQTPAHEASSDVKTAPNALRASLRKRPSAAKVSPRQPHDPRAEDLTTGFIALPGSEGLPTPSEASVVRVSMVKGDLQRYGFEVPPSVVAEMVQADFVLGEDGLPRAVRLVQRAQ